MTLVSPGGLDNWVGFCYDGCGDGCILAPPHGPTSDSVFGFVSVIPVDKKVSMVLLPCFEKRSGLRVQESKSETAGTTSSTFFRFYLTSYTSLCVEH